MFSFRKNRKEALHDPKTVARWLAGFPASDPLATHTEIMGELGKIAEHTAKRSTGTLAAVFRLDSDTTALRRTLTSQYNEHASRSPKIEHQLWSALFEIGRASCRERV